MEASAAAIGDAERARQEAAQRRAQVAWAGGRIAQLEGVLVAARLGIPAPIKPPPAAPSAAPPPAQVAAPNPKGSSAVAGGVMQRLTSTEAALEVSQAETVQLRKQLEAAQRALEAQSQLSSGGARRSRSAHDLAGVAAAASAGGAGLAAELARERQRADTAERAARAAAEAVRRLTEDLEEKQQEVDEALAAAAEAAEHNGDAQLPAANGGDAHSDAVRAAAVALRGALVTERERSKALEAELITARNAAATAEQRAQSAIAAAAAAAASAAAVMSASNGASRGSKSGPGAFSGEEAAYADERGPPALHSPSLAVPMEPRGRRGSATGRGGDAERRAAVAEEAAEAAEAKVTRLRDALAEEKRSADALRAQLLARAGEQPERSAPAAGAGDAAARKRAKDAETALIAERERRTAAEARARAAEEDSEELVQQLAAARLASQREAEAAPQSPSAGADRIATLERMLVREREAAAHALAEARAAASSGGAGAAGGAALDADDIGPARALLAERQRSAQLSAQLSEVTARLARSAVSGGSPAPAAQQSPGVANELARLQARCRSLQEALDNSEARGCELEQELAEARAPRNASRRGSANPSPRLSPVPFPDE